MDRYALDNDAVQAPQRFNVLERCYDHRTRAHLDGLGLSEGWRCLEVGAGAGSVAAWMADRVGPSGSVLATDLKPVPGAERRANLEVVQHDITVDDLPADAFDLVHARLVLLHLPGRIETLERIVGTLKPGGVLLLEEFDCSWTPVLRAPNAEAVRLFEKVHAAFLRRLEAAGADPLWGQRVYGAMGDAGLSSMGCQTYAEAWPGGGEGIAMHRANTEQLAPDLLREGLTEDELARFWHLLNDPAFAVNSYPLVSAWGRRPETGKS